MENKQLFASWAPKEGYIWTKFAKPALFVHAQMSYGKFITAENIPSQFLQLCDKNTAVIIDMPGATSVTYGLGMAKAGYRPVPLYNGIHEQKNGGLDSIVDNASITNALVSGEQIMRTAILDPDAPAAFLLDSNRNPYLPDTFGKYDNRWTIDPEDMPSTSYLQEQGITKILIMSDRDIQPDLLHIINRYRQNGITVKTFIDSQLVALPKVEKYLNVTATGTTVEPESISARVAESLLEAVRVFENARFSLLLITFMAIINFIGMFFVNEEPFLWITPSIMWLTYLWVNEVTGDIIAILMTITYVVLYLSTAVKRNLIILAFLVFTIDAAMFYMYVLYYGVLSFTGYSLMYGLIVLIPPVIALTKLKKGEKASRMLMNLNDDDYLLALEYIDGHETIGPIRRVRPHMRFFRGYRSTSYRSTGGFLGGGYGGYGGTGKGGYGGNTGGYRSFGG